MLTTSLSLEKQHVYNSLADISRISETKFKFSGIHHANIKTIPLAKVLLTNDYTLKYNEEIETIFSNSVISTKFSLSKFNSTLLQSRDLHKIQQPHKRRILLDKNLEKLSMLHFTSNQSDEKCDGKGNVKDFN